jgi:hypothetical protein
MIALKRGYRPLLTVAADSFASQRTESVLVEGLDLEYGAACGNCLY